MALKKKWIKLDVIKMYISIFQKLETLTIREVQIKFTPHGVKKIQISANFFLRLSNK